MELEVVDIKGKKVGSAAVAEGLLKEPSDHGIYLDVKQYLANQRQGTHKSKERAEIAGSTKKIKKQKGTGTARAGSLKSPVFVGGGRIFGPRPRNYYFKLNKKQKEVARRSALTYKVNESNLLLLNEEVNIKPNTKEALSLLNSIGLSGEKVLFLTSEISNSGLVKSTSNLSGVNVKHWKDVSTYDLLKANKVVCSEEVFTSLSEKLTS